MNQPTRLPAAAFEFDQPEAQAPQARPGPKPSIRMLEPDTIKREIRALIESGKMPEGFDIENAVTDRAFMELVMEMPTDAAIRVYAAEQRAQLAEQNAQTELSKRISNRAALPQSTRANASAAPSRDYMAMSPEAFAAVERQYREKARNGVKVKL